VTGGDDVTDIRPSHSYAAHSNEQFASMVAHAEVTMARTGTPEVIHRHRHDEPCGDACLRMDPPQSGQPVGDAPPEESSRDRDPDVQPDPFAYIPNVSRNGSWPTS
jgi:hypothetical protein